MIKIEDLKVGDRISHNFDPMFFYTVKSITEYNNVLVLNTNCNKTRETFIEEKELKYYNLEPKQKIVYIVIFRTKLGKIYTRKMYYESDVNNFGAYNDVLNVISYVEFNND